MASVTQTKYYNINSNEKSTIPHKA